MIAQGSLLLAVLEGDELLAIHLERHEVAWRRSVGESGPLVMTADAEAAYVATNAGRVMRVAALRRIEIAWERQPRTGTLSEPTVDGDRLFVGSNADTRLAVVARRTHRRRQVGPWRGRSSAAPSSGPR